MPGIFTPFCVMSATKLVQRQPTTTGPSRKFWLPPQTLQRLPRGTSGLKNIEERYVLGYSWPLKLISLPGIFTPFRVMSATKSVQRQPTTTGRSRKFSLPPQTLQRLPTGDVGTLSYRIRIKNMNVSVLN